jgi:hypothetical protein
VGEVEREERLVREDQDRVGDERLRHAEPLLLPPESRPTGASA